MQRFDVQWRSHTVPVWDLKLLLPFEAHLVAMRRAAFVGCPNGTVTSDGLAGVYASVCTGKAPEGAFL